MEVKTSISKLIEKKSVCIVKLGPQSSTDGLRMAEFYQVTVDPSKVSPSGEYIRFGLNQGDEIQGWQKTEAITILEILAEWDGEEPPKEIVIGHDGITMMVAQND